MTTNSIKTLIFDFDGTIADTIDVMLTIYNSTLAPKFNCRPLDKEMKQQMRAMNPREMMHVFGASLVKLPFMVAKARSELAKRIDDIKPHTGICEALRQIKNKGVQCGLLTSNSRHNVLRFLKCHELTDIFDFICTGKHLFGKHTILRRVIRKEDLSPETSVYVGDEMRDIEAAHKAGIRVAAVTWGYNNKKALTKHNPEWVIDVPEGLLAIITHPK